jgi:hypothetical protein
MIKRWGSQAIVFLMWLLHWLPLPLLAAIGEGVGALLWRLAGSRRKVVLKNLALCFPELDEARGGAWPASTSVPWRAASWSTATSGSPRKSASCAWCASRATSTWPSAPAGRSCGCCRTSSGWTTPPRR